MAKLVRPMKPYSKTPSLDLLTYPKYVSNKIDGVRCYIDKGVALSNANKPLPNEALQAWAYRNAGVLQGYDGEVIKRGNFTDFNVNQSLVMSKDGGKDFQFLVFDIMDVPYLPYSHRLSTLETNDVFSIHPSKVVVLPQFVVHTAEELQAYWDGCVEQGLEGAIARNMDAPYKYGRSTLKEQYVIKLKVWHDAEATIIGFNEKMKNNNKAAMSELGLSKRSSHKVNKAGTNTLGSLVVRRITDYGDCFCIGTGFTAKQRKELWKIRDSLIGQQCTYKFISEDEDTLIPRHPVFKGLRSDHL